MLLAVLVAACSAPSEETADDGTGALTGKSAPAPSCDASDTALFFHGLNGGGHELGGDGICAPAIANGGASGFWSDVAFASAPSARVVGGYSAGRIPLIRRLEADDAHETTAVLLDGSWADGPRYDGRTGPDIVRKWLERDPTRVFVLVHLDSSAGWREYAALAQGDVGERVKICTVTHGVHGELARIVGPELFLDPEAWLRERCIDGRAQ